MLKLLFWGLLLANGALFAFHQGYLDTLIPDGREPARMGRQFNADKIKLVAAGQPSPTAAPAAASEAASSAAAAGLLELEPVLARASKRQESLVCAEIGNFDTAEAKRFESQAAAQALIDKLSRRNVQEVARHMVYIPSQGSKDAADKKASELRRLGVDDFYVIQDGTELRWGISLGIFKSEEAARAHLATLGLKGVRSARLGVHGSASAKVAFQLHELDLGARSRLDKIKADFPRQEVRACESATSTNPA